MTVVPGQGLFEFAVRCGRTFLLIGQMGGRPLIGQPFVGTVCAAGVIDHFPPVVLVAGCIHLMHATSQ